MKKIYIQILILLACIPFSGMSQVFPVNATPQVIPPYSLKLSEYSTATVSEKLLLTLLLTDITESNRQVRLKLFIENNAGLAIQSSEVVIGANPIYLDGGIPKRLSNIDLQAYFSLQNLQGITPQQYSQPLPEGLYRFCFEVYDALSGRQISRKSCATAYLVLNDPPFLNIPNRGEQVLLRDPQNVIFQWTPRHLNATNVSYEFTLAELWDTQMDPQAAFLASRPLYQTTTFATTLLYGPGETSLLPDKTYGWRVRAMISDGISESSVFENDGYSEIYYFTYTGSCAEPAFVIAEGKSPTNEKILWQGVDHRRYNVQYRKKDAENSIWFDSPTVNTYTTIYNLEPGTSYEFRVGGQCLDKGPFTYSQIYQFTTTIAADQESTYNCGITPEIVIHNQDPLETMVINETFTAGDFPVTVKEVNGNNGSFSGWGYIVVPYLQDTKIKVSFDNIRINTEYQLLEGIVVTDYDENWGGVDDIGNEIDALLSLGDAIVEALNLDIDSDTKNKIKSIVKSITDNIKDEDLPDDLRNSIVTAAENLESSKKEYDKAKEELEKASTPEEKKAAQEKMDFAKQNFKDAQEEIRDTQQEVDKFIKKSFNIIKDALYEIVRDYNDNKETLESHLVTSTSALPTADVNFQNQGTEMDDLIAYTETVEIQSLANSNLLTPEEKEQILTYYFSQIKFNRIVVAKIFVDELNNEEGYQKLAIELTKDSKKLGDFINDELDKDELSRSELVDQVKEVFYQRIEKLLFTEVYNYEVSN